MYYEDLDEGEALSKDEQHILEKTEAMSVEHSVIVAADVAYTNRWVERRLTPVKMRGDLAVFCDNDTDLKLIATWANEERDHVRCAEDLADAGFAESLKYGAEVLYLEQAMTAFVGTAEERAEQPELPPLDCVEGDEDTGALKSSREDERRQSFST